MNTYDFIFIATKDTKEFLKSIEDLIKKGQGAISKQETLGRKQFAYRIKKLLEGYYFQWSISMPASEVLTLRTKLNLHEDVVRYLILKTK